MYELKDSYFIIIDPLAIIIFVVTILLVVTGMVYFRKRTQRDR
ncbi:hypothetical protein [Sporosarcina cyprini]|nr:hypothetical protein [Sporosarcina cyprini]